MDKHFSKCRITDTIIDHWDEIRGDRKFPSEDSLDLKCLSGVIDSCCLVQTRDIGGGAYNYSYLGKKIVEAYGRDLTRQSHRLLTAPQANHLQAVYEQIIRRKEPIIDDGEFKNLSGQTVKYRQVLVPLGDSDDKVESILCGMRYKIF